MTERERRLAEAGFEYAEGMTVSDSAKMRRHVERLIATAFIKDALAKGYKLNVYNGGDEEELAEPSADAEAVLAAMFATDEDYLNVYTPGDKRLGWVRFIYGNSGWDVISDYTTSLEHVMAGATAESKKWE